MMTTEKRIGDYVKAEIDFWRDKAEALETANAELREALRYQLAVGSGCTCDPSLPVSEGTCPYHKAHALLARHDSSSSGCQHPLNRIRREGWRNPVKIEPGELATCLDCGKAMRNWNGTDKWTEAFHDSSSSGAEHEQSSVR